MFNVGGPEIVLVILVALVVLGPEQLPKAMRTFGSVMGEVRKLSSGFQSEMRDAMKAVEFDGLTSPTDPKAKGTSASKSTGTTTVNGPADQVQEVVARNEGPVPSPAPGTGSSTESSGPSAADRAAG